MKDHSEESEEQFEGDLENAIPDEQSGKSDFEGLRESLTSEIENRQPRSVSEKEVKVIGVYEHQEQGMPPMAFVLLRDNQGRQVLIYIGRFEACAISIALEGASAERPMTHDLLKSILDRLGARIDRIVIDDLWQDTYYAKIYVSTNGTALDIDSRPSDAIALALRTKAPIYMAESVLEQAAVNEDI